MTESATIYRRSAMALGLAVALTLAGAVAGSAAAVPGFTDVTTAAGIDFFSGVMDTTPGFPMHGGMTVIDYNRDGWPDLFVVGGGNTNDRLYRNNADGTFSNVAPQAGLTALYRGNGANAGDYNRDGCEDIFVQSHGDLPGAATNGQHKLWRNNCDGTFTNVSVAAGVNSTGNYPDGYGAAWGDYNLDGWLDLWAGGWHTPGDVGNHSLNNTLFRNNRDGTFTEVTDTFGLFTNATRGFGAIFADMDGDRWPELMVAGDFGTSKYYSNLRNDNGFRGEPILSPGDSKVHNGMGTTIADVDRDGDQDWFITAIYPAWGGAGPPGNRLYINDGGNRFHSLPDSGGVNNGGWGWGADARDFNHDGWLDLIHTNGWPNCPDPWTGECFTNENTKLFRNTRDLRFRELSEEWGLLNYLEGRGLVTFDYDRDGDMDVAISSNWAAGPGDPPDTGALKLYRNELSGTNIRWLKVYLDPSASPFAAPFGYGADVRVTTPNGVTQFVRIHGGSNYLSKSENVAHFGVGNVRVVDRVAVIWPDGFRTLLTDVATNQQITVAAPTPLTHTPLVRGETATVTIVGLAPGETASLAVSTIGTGAGPCYPALGGLCVNLLSPQGIGAAVADGTGTVVIQVSVPAGWPDTVHLQAAIKRGQGGRASLKTNVSSAPVAN